MFNYATKELEKLGAIHTTLEIKQQPKVWLEAFDNYMSYKKEIDAFLAQVKSETRDRVRVIFTGAGTSCYVGDTVTPYLNQHGDSGFIYESVATTDIVGSPLDYLRPDDWTILVSFARSGNSPESVAAVEIANQVVKNIRHISITCVQDGLLAKAAENDANHLLLLQPEKSLDLGFAMTSSFSCIMLTALLVFDVASDSDKRIYVKTMAKIAADMINRECEIADIINRDFNRIIYLGTGALAGLTREAQLKVLELTAGQVATIFDSSLGFRHGPKSFINDKTLVFNFVNNDDYARQYDIDILNEMKQDGIANSVITIAQPKVGQDFDGETIEFEKGLPLLPEAYSAFPCIVVAQIVSVLTSLKVGNTPDTPSATGTVNRVVQGVTIHAFDK
ncbi:SIS domain-containing protein [Lactococcus laudensis]|uniref:SIS domain-containing protein n=1 Tax=Pseudolactococcus laudensis TaxID=1494461 RepID=A0A7V8N1R3_9LACT|nr:SIS domain-containing protein [Lactococcus laudensis]MBA0017118.1 SIS domain-containing protein [Lactococcus laudensis]MBW9281835.1 SIS domain-containing protein [Lactococcus laudensis]